MPLLSKAFLLKTFNCLCAGSQTLEIAALSDHIAVLPDSVKRKQHI